MSLVTVLVNRDCGHCLRAVEQVENMAHQTGARIAATDITAHPEVCDGLRIKTSPVVVFEGNIAYPGVPDKATFEALTHCYAG